MRNLWYEVLNYANSREFRPFTFVTSSVLGLYPSTHIRLCTKNYSIYRPLVNQSCWIIFPLWKTYQTLASIPQLFIFLLPKMNNIFHRLQVLYSHEERVRQALELAEKDSSLTGNSRNEVQQRCNFFSNFLEKPGNFRENPGGDFWELISMILMKTYENHAVLGYFEGYTVATNYIEGWSFPSCLPFQVDDPSQSIMVNHHSLCSSMNVLIVVLGRNASLSERTTKKQTNGLDGMMMFWWWVASLQIWITWFCIL